MAGLWEDVRKRYGIVYIWKAMFKIKYNLSYCDEEKVMIEYIRLCEKQKIEMNM